MIVAALQIAVYGLTLAGCATLAIRLLGQLDTQEDP